MIHCFLVPEMLDSVLTFSGRQLYRCFDVCAFVCPSRYWLYLYPFLCDGVCLCVCVSWVSADLRSSGTDNVITYRVRLSATIHVYNTCHFLFFRGFSVSVCGRHHIFKPVSVQAMWWVKVLLQKFVLWHSPLSINSSSKQMRCFRVRAFLEWK